jgi:hypothetical protein
LRAALAAQRESPRVNAPIDPLDADDAHRVLARRHPHARTSSPNSFSTGSSGTGTTTSIGSAAASTGALWPGATGDIRLDAK